MSAKQRCEEIIEWMRDRINEKNREGMRRFGIKSDNAFGLSLPSLRARSKEIGKDHDLALELWKTGYHEARILAPMIAQITKTTPELMDQWAEDFDSWDVCDQCCLNFFRHTPYVDEMATRWAGREEEFVRRAGFALMAVYASGNKKVADDVYASWLPLIEAGGSDERNFVKKAVNWALRGIGKRNYTLYNKALETAQRMSASDSHSARWIGRDALREFGTEKVIKRIETGKFR